ncbi:MAG: AlpA family phage regulatory protein [Chloroflexota bacterium]|nr:AlpA family phage regulatory protein [Chloroflexota bacterium]
MRVREVEKTLGISRSTIWRLVKAGTFPPPLRITSKAIAWRKSDIEAWQQQLAEQAVA